jgi:hypothetical protein
MKYAIRALLAVAGGAFVGAGMYAFALARHAEDLAYGFTVWGVLWREFLAVSILVALALATPRRRGLRLLWLLVGALWVWLLVLPPIDTADAGPPGVAFLYRFQSWSGIALPLFLVMLAHWSPAYRSIRDLRTPAALLALWIAGYALCARYDWINSDWISPDVNYAGVALLCWIFLAAPPLLLIRWILGRDREVYPAQTRAEAWLWSGMAPLVRSRLTATVAGIFVAMPGFIAIRIFQGERGLFADWMVLICSLLAGPVLGMALRRHAGTVPRASRMPVMATGPARP